MERDAARSIAESWHASASKIALARATAEADAYEADLKRSLPSPPNVDEVDDIDAYEKKLRFGALIDAFFALLYKGRDGW